MENNNFEIMVWENIYPIHNGKVCFDLGNAGNTFIYETFDTLEKANNFYNNVKLNEPKYENNYYITQEKLLIDNRNCNDTTIKKFEKRKIAV